MSFYPVNDNGYLHARCGNCGQQLPLDALDPIKDPGERLSIGEETPAGECPDCHALCYAVEDPAIEIRFEITGAAFEDNLPFEVAQILASVQGDGLSQLADQGSLVLRDTNGNTVGRARII